MKSILDIPVSYFANYKSTAARDVTLLKWLTSTKYADKVNAIRQISDKPERDKLKALLPAITPSGVFSKREAARLIKHSGFIQIDVDNVPDIQAAKANITNIENVAYCGLSVSGKGLWALIPISEPEHHTAYFTFIEKAFACIGITIDTGCKDVSRLRGYSYDEDAYFNHSAVPMLKYFKPEKHNPQKQHFKPVYGDNTVSNVNTCLNQIQSKGIDLTASYDRWFKIGCSLANEFGEAGRDYFHTVSQFHLKYNPADTDKQFSRCLKKRYVHTIDTFFKACKEAGVYYKPTAAQDFENLNINGLL